MMNQWLSKIANLFCLLYLFLNSLQCVRASSALLSAVNYYDTKVGPYGWKYFRAELPVEFSAISLSWKKKWGKVGDQASSKGGSAPFVCFRFGGLPVPATAVESLMIAAVTAGRVQNVLDKGDCAYFLDTVSFNLTNHQVLSGVLFIGVFSDPNPRRTQSQMISRGNVYSFDLEVKVFGCKHPLASGQDCTVDLNKLGVHPSILLETGKDDVTAADQVIPGSSSSSSASNDSSTHGEHGHSCMPSSNRYFDRDDTGGKCSQLSSRENPSFEGRKEFVFGQPENDSWLSIANQCTKPGEWRFHVLRVMDITSRLEFKVEQNSESPPRVYIRYGALPDNTTFSYSLDGAMALSIEAPKIGEWYVGVDMKHVSEFNGSAQCYSLFWRLHTCQSGKIGEDCLWNLTALERVMRRSIESPFDSYYRPVGSGVMPHSDWFASQPVPVSTNSGTSSNHEAWAYYYLKVPQGAAGSVLSLNFIGSASTSFQIYVRFEGPPTLDMWDYHNASSQLQTFKQAADSLGYQQTKSSVKLDLVYPSEGAWYIGVRSFLTLGTNAMSGESPVKSIDYDVWEGKENTSTPTRTESENSVSDVHTNLGLHGCVGKCSGHGICQTSTDESRLYFYSYCYCDRTHGGLDCSEKIVAAGGQSLHIVALVASNLAALLPSLWSLRQKAYAEWIVYTTSGLSSAIYHSCDTDGWCALSYDTLQFLDFWLSFLAVVVTFLYMAAFVGSLKTALHIGAAIFTAVIAKESATSAANILLVMCIGGAGLLMGFFWESCSPQRCARAHTSWSLSCMSFGGAMRWRTIRVYMGICVEMVRETFRWQYVLLGIFTLALAKLDLLFQTASTYWIWHSVWHVSIYTSAFCFLRSRIMGVATEAEFDNLGLGGRFHRMAPSGGKRIIAHGDVAELAAFVEEGAADVSNEM